MRKKPKVCLIRQYYFPQEVHLRRDVKALMEGGFEVDVICARDSGEKLFENWNGVNIYRIPICHRRKGMLRYIYEYLYFFIHATVLLTRLFFRKRYECIEVDTMPDFLVFAAFVPKLFRRKIILYLFENMPMLFADKYKLGPGHPLIRFLKMIELMSVKFADQLIITHKRREKIFKKSIIILNVPDEEMFLSGVSVMSDQMIHRSDLYNAKEVVNIVTHSTLTEIYGIQNLLRAIACLKDNYPRIRCEIIGTGEYQRDLIELAQSLCLDNCVQFKGFIPFEKIAGALCAADIGVVSVLCDYLLPNKLFEYIALGIPVICSAVKAIRDFFDEDELCFYNPHDFRDLARQIEWVMFHYDLARERINKAYLKYSNEYCWVKLKDIYINCHHQKFGR
ncbi:MAG: glycosyltransferase [candidate division WOR-3 bacterium]